MRDTHATTTAPVGPGRSFGSVPAMTEDTDREFTRASLQAVDSFGVTVTAEFLSAVLVWALIGFGLDRWLDTGPWLFAGGTALGFALGTYLAYLRYQHQSEQDDAARPRL